MVSWCLGRRREVVRGVTDGTVAALYVRRAGGDDDQRRRDNGGERRRSECAHTRQPNHHIWVGALGPRSPPVYQARV